MIFINSRPHRNDPSWGILNLVSEGPYFSGEIQLTKSLLEFCLKILLVFHEFQVDFGFRDDEP